MADQPDQHDLTTEGRHMSGYDGAIRRISNGDTLQIATGGKIVPNSGTQASTIADAAVTATLSGVDTGTDMTAAQAATIVADLTTLTTKLNAVLAALEGVGILASS